MSARVIAQHAPVSESRYATHVRKKQSVPGSTRWIKARRCYNLVAIVGPALITWITKYLQGGDPKDMVLKFKCWKCWNKLWNMALEIM